MRFDFGSMGYEWDRPFGKLTVAIEAMAMESSLNCLVKMMIFHMLLYQRGIIRHPEHHGFKQNDRFLDDNIGVAPYLQETSISPG